MAAFSEPSATGVLCPLRVNGMRAYRDIFTACSLEVVIKLASTARVKIFDGEFSYLRAIWDTLKIY